MTDIVIQFDGDRVVNDGIDPQATPQMLQMLNAFILVQALHTTAALGIADRLSTRSLTAEELAKDAGAHPQSLYRLLRMLAAAGVLREDGERRFALTRLGATLQKDVPGSVRDWALFVGSPEMWQVWGQLLDTVTTGEAALPRVHGMALWQLLAEHAELGAAFDRWMSRQSDQHNAALVASYDFSPFRTVADIGGGQGSTLAAILTAHPSLHGILLDLPQVVTRTPALDEAGVLHRCTVIGGDMLREVPAGADVYLVKRVLMDWGDEQATAILRNCARAVPDGGKVLAVEMVLPADPQPGPGWGFDLLMLLNHPGGRIRTEDEYRALLLAAGLRLTKVWPTSSPNSVLEGER